MKGRIDLRYEASGLHRLRSRVSEPSAQELSQYVRRIFAEVVVEILNASQEVFVGKVLDRVLGLQKLSRKPVVFKSDAAASKVVDSSRDVFGVDFYLKEISLDGVEGSRGLPDGFVMRDGVVERDGPDVVDEFS